MAQYRARAADDVEAGSSSVASRFTGAHGGAGDDEENADIDCDAIIELIRNKTNADEVTSKSAATAALVGIVGKVLGADAASGALPPQRNVVSGPRDSTLPTAKFSLRTKAWAAAELAALIVQGPLPSEAEVASTAEGSSDDGEVNEGDAPRVLIDPATAIARAQLSAYEKQMNSGQQKVYKSFTTACGNGEPLLTLLTGAGGTGKTRVAKALCLYLELNAGTTARFIAPTGVAASQNCGETMHRLLSLQALINVESRLASLRGGNPNLAAQLQKSMGTSRVLVIDEISFVTAPWLALIEHRMRDAFDGNVPWGGISIILIGDFHQLTPVEGMPLDYTCTRLEMGDPLSTVNRAGAEIFLSFQKFTLTEQCRSTDATHTKTLQAIRDLREPRPITPQMLKAIPYWCADDIVRDEMWRFPMIITQENRARRAFNELLVRAYAQHAGVPLLKYTSHIRISRGRFGRIEEHQGLGRFKEQLVEKYSEITHYFARGARCIILYNINTRSGLSNGTPGVLESLTWDDDDDTTRHDDSWYAALPPYTGRGTEIEVEQPVFTNVFLKGNGDHIRTALDRIVPVKNGTTYIKYKAGLESKALAFKTPYVDLLYASTSWKIQGATLDRVVLAVLSGERNTTTLETLYVLLSRVREGRCAFFVSPPSPPPPSLY